MLNRSLFQLILAAFACFYLPEQAHSQTTQVDSFLHGGIMRSYRYYVPAIYNPGTPAPLVFNLHGYTSSASAQELYTNFNAVADTAGFILVMPEGTLDPNNFQFWNVGFISSTVDDLGFIEALIDSFSSDYNINPDRIYSTGMSNGAFMSELLACQSDRIAAIAPVAGTRSFSTQANCSPSHPVPVLQIHGTADGTVPYAGTIGVESVQANLNYWVNFNGCSTTPVITPLPDIVLTDGVSAEHWVYANSQNGATVEHYKAINGGHTWPGTFPIGPTCQDFSGTKEIWRFFNQHPRIITSVPEPSADFQIAVFPNPGQDFLEIQSNENKPFRLFCFDLYGKKIWEDEIREKTTKINTSDWPSGIYVFRVELSTISSKMWIKQ